MPVRPVQPLATSGKAYPIHEWSVMLLNIRFVSILIVLLGVGLVVEREAGAASKIEPQASVAVASPPTLQAAQMADSFVDSIGVDTHLSYKDSPYYTRFSEWKALLVRSGIRHIRDAADVVAERYNDLASSGIKSTYLLSYSDTPDSVAAWVGKVAGSVDAIETINEADLNGEPVGVWVPKLRKYQQEMYVGLKHDPKTAPFPFYGPSMGSDGSKNPYAELGDLTSFLDYGNTHEYFAGFSPGTTGWGDDGYGSIEWDLRQVSVTSQTKPVVTTEAGYSDKSTLGGAPKEIVARYLPRLLLLQWLHGIHRTFLYQWIVQGNDGFQDCGILTADLKPKPSYYALKSLATSLADKGGPFRTHGLSYSVSGVDASVQRLLFEKRDGTYDLVAWVEQPSFDPNAYKELSVAPQMITVAFENRPARVSAETIGDDGHLAPKAVVTNGSQANIQLTDHVTIIRIEPSLKTMR